MDTKMKSMNDYAKEVFGEKVYKISLNIGCTCPNRDGTLDTRGCIFCSEGGSGDFASSALLSIDEQIEDAKKRIKGKYAGNRFIAYLQAYTNTYGPIDKLRDAYMKIASRDEIVAISIATRPDCLGKEVIMLLQEVSKIKPLWVELGLQTTNEKTARYIRRGYELPIYDEAVKKLHELNVHVITHVILGLPGETTEDMVDTVKHVVKVKSDGIKLQLLHVLKGTDLFKDYMDGKFKVLSMDEYLNVLSICLKEIPEDMVVHRLTGDGPKKLLVAPLWSADKKRVLNEINRL